MNLYVQQSISIHLLKVDNVSNSSVLQIGSSGIIKPVSHLYNTGGFTKPAPTATTPGIGPAGTNIEAPAVPLTTPTA